MAGGKSLPASDKFPSGGAGDGLRNGCALS